MSHPTFNATGVLAALIKERRLEGHSVTVVAPEVHKQASEGLAQVVGALQETDRYVRDSLKAMQPSIVEASTLNPGVAEDLVQTLRNSAVEHFGTTLKDVLPAGAATVVFDYLRSDVYTTLNSLLDGRLAQWAPGNSTSPSAIEASRKGYSNGTEEPSELRKKTAHKVAGVFMFSEYGTLRSAAHKPGWDEWVDQRSGLAADAELIGEVNKLSAHRAWMFAAFFEPKLLKDPGFNARLQEAVQDQAGPNFSPSLAMLVNDISAEVARQAREQGFTSQPPRAMRA
jgi:hypothetical protein